MRPKKRIAFHILLWLFVAWCLAPFAWQVITSLKTNAEIGAIPNVYVPDKLGLHHYADLFQRKPFARYLLNSVIVSLGTTVGVLALCSLAGYGFARLEFPFRRAGRCQARSCFR